MFLKQFSYFKLKETKKIFVNFTYFFQTQLRFNKVVFGKSLFSLPNEILSFLKMSFRNFPFILFKWNSNLFIAPFLTLYWTCFSILFTWTNLIYLNVNAVNSEQIHFIKGSWNNVPDVEMNEGISLVFSSILYPFSLILNKERKETIFS